MKINFANIKKNKGSSPVTAIIIILVLTLVFVLFFEIFTVQSVYDNVHECVEQAIKTIATANETIVYKNIRENLLVLSSDELSRLVTVDELTERLCNELGLYNDGEKLYKYISSGGYGYAIYDLNINNIYIDSVNTICFEATGKIDIPIIAFKNIVPDITIDMSVKSLYASKLRVVE